MTTSQSTLFDNETNNVIGVNSLDKYSGTFSKNMSTNVHGWYRYSAGFSSEWVNRLIYQEKENGRNNVLDPFVGSGTVLIEAEKCGMASIGIESYPFVSRIARAKLQWRENPNKFKKYANEVIEYSKKLTPSIDDYPDLITKCYPVETLKSLDVIRRAWLQKDDSSPISELVWLALASILRQCSPVGTAQWQYVLPNRTKARTVDPYDAFWSKVALMAKDMAYMQRVARGPKAMLYEEDARECKSVLHL